MYAITVHTAHTRKDNGYEEHSASPTFYLNEDVQGIVDSNHAEDIVKDWIQDLIAATDGDPQALVDVFAIHIDLKGK